MMAGLKTSLVAGGLLLAALVAAQAQQNFRSVTPVELRERPQNYWARGVIFKDTLLSRLEGRDFRYEGKRYPPIVTKVLGACYIQPELEGLVREFPLNREYLFSGIVLQSRGNYYVVIQGFNAVVDSSELSKPFQELVADIQIFPPRTWVPPSWKP